MRIRLRLYIAIQAVPSDWSMKPPVGSGAERSKTPMLSSPRKPPWKMLRPWASRAVDPPGEVEHQLVEDALQECAVALAAPATLEVIDPERRPGVDGRVHVAEVPLVGGELAVGVHVPLAPEQDELRLRECGIDEGER